MRPPSASELHGPSLESWRRHLGGSAERPVRSPSLLRWALGRGTLASLVTRNFPRRAAETLLVIDGHPATGAELLAGSEAVAARLAEAGVDPRARVLVALPSSIDFAMAYFGVHQAGCSVVLANPSLTAPELVRLLAVGSPVAGIVSPAVADIVGAQVLPPSEKLSEESVLVAFDGARHATSGRTPPTGPDDEAVLAWTSGSTGEPKGVPLSHANLLSSMRGAMAAWRWTRDDVVVHSLPLYHQHGLGALHAMALGGGRAVIHSHFDPDALTSTLEAERASILLAVPAIYQRLVDAAPPRKRFSSLRVAVSGSAPLPPSLFEQITETTGTTPVERYGMTESGLDVSNLHTGPRKPGAIGYALPGVETVVVAADGEIAAPGADGEIWLRGPQVFSGYLGGAGDEVLTRDGWLRSGDIGRIDPDDGAMSITGRAKDVIISGGMNVFPREVELVLEQHAAVAAVAVGGVRSARWGEEVVAFVVTRGDAPPSSPELDELCRRSLAPYKRPKRFVIVGELPRNHMGKLVRSALAELAPPEPGNG